MSVLEALRDYFSGCPSMADQRIDIDCLGTMPTSCSIDAVPAETVTKRYLDGSTVRRCLFTLSSRMYYGLELEQQAENAAFFDTVTDWIERSIALPQLGTGRRARSLRVLSSAYPIVIDSDTGHARYQIQCELIYLQEAFL